MGTSPERKSGGELHYSRLGLPTAKTIALTGDDNNEYNPDTAVK
jgi:hypothetical protein